MNYGLPAAVCHTAKVFHVFARLILAVTLCSPVFAFTFEVTNTNDTGAGSLREAMSNAVANSGVDTVAVNLPPGSIIKPQSQLPGTFPATPNEPTIIMGNGVTVSGEDLEGSEHGFGFYSNGNQLNNVTVVNFPGHGVYIEGDSNRIVNCRIGTDGTTAMPNGGDGVHVALGDDNVVGLDSVSGAGNVISGNGGRGVYAALNPSGLKINGNIIGLNAAGTAAIPNGSHGIELSAGAAEIGGSTPGFRNIVSGNTEDGIQLSAQAVGGTIQNNFVGTNQAGTAAIPNGGSGISVRGTNPTGAQVGGAGADEGNVVSGNAVAGVDVRGANHTIQGNLIGLRGDGSGLALGNSGDGILVFGADDLLIGGTTAGAGNEIANNGGAGVSMGLGAQQVTVSRNSIHDNSNVGISVPGGNNNNISPPSISGIGPITGTTVANATVEFFVDMADEGRTYITSTQSNGAGAFTQGADLNAFVGQNLTATVTDSNGNTSAFSSVFVITLVDNEGEGEAEIGEGEAEAPTEGETGSCEPARHSADIDFDNMINLSELLRVIQFFNIGGYSYCPDDLTEDGFCPGL